MRIGSGAVDLWVRSPVNDADLEINLIEVRPDGQERFVQSGWLRASLRALDPSATELWPEHTYTQADAAPLVPGEWTAARVGFCAFGHVFRAGIPAPLAPALMWLFERLKFIVRLRKRALFHLRYWRASLEDAFTR